MLTLPHSGVPIGPVLMLLAAVFGFLLGSIPFGLLVARMYGLDIREHGSGNIGMTNVWRVLGWKAGMTVLMLDTLKGWLPVAAVANYISTNLSAYHSGGVLSIYTDVLYIPVFTGLAAVLGHTFTPWLRFKGGKGVATGLGVVIALFGIVSLIPLAVFLVVLATSRMVSVSSLLAALSLPILGYLYHLHMSVMFFGLAVFLLVLWTHRSNIMRILNGTENRVSFGRRKSV